MILGNRCCTERLGGTARNWGQETLHRSMNQSRLFLALTQQHRYHNPCTLTTATSLPQPLYTHHSNIATTIPVHSPQQHRYHNPCTLTTATSPAQSLYTHCHIVTSLPQTQCSDSPPDQHSSEQFHSRLATLHSAFRDRNFNLMFFFSGARQPAPVTLLYVRPQTRENGTCCLAVNNRESHVGFNTEWVMKALKEITAG